jgi:hypothetical protein
MVLTVDSAAQLAEQFSSKSGAMAAAMLHLGVAS